MRVLNLFLFKEEDKEEMKEILEMKRTHDKLYKRRMAKMEKELSMNSPMSRSDNTGNKNIPSPLI